jgi:hypothetical protein
MKNLLLAAVAVLLFTACGSDKPTKPSKPLAGPTVYNGYNLPAEPDPDLNRATLKGIDSNHNGIRDDVEIAIIKTFKPNTIEMRLASSRIYNKINTPNISKKRAMEISDEDDLFSACTDYLKCHGYIGGVFGDNDWTETYHKADEILYNTPERAIASERYEQRLSGGVYSTPDVENRRQTCIDFGIDFSKMVQIYPDKDPEEDNRHAKENK